MEDWKRSGWVDSMVKAIGKAKWFRWFDSGDVCSAELAQKIYNVILQTPNCEHWLPTRSYKIKETKDWLQRMSLLDNVTVRLSSDSVTGERIPGDYTSTIIQSPEHFIPSKGYSLCRAFERKGKCGSCRACWSKSIHTIAYIAHQATPAGSKPHFWGCTARLPFWQSRKFFHFFLAICIPRLYNIRIMENISYYDSSYSPNEACEASDVPACSNCADTGVIEKGYDVRSTVFCDCKEGDETFCAWADAEGAMAHECDEYDSDYGATADYWQNDAGEWSCG